LFAAQGQHEAAERMRERAELCRRRAERHRAALSGERNGSRPGERAGELGEDRQVGVSIANPRSTARFAEFATRWSHPVAVVYAPDGFSDSETAWATETIEPSTWM
jgi:hypothetical protein